MNLLRSASSCVIVPLVSVSLINSCCFTNLCAIVICLSYIGGKTPKILQHVGSRHGGTCMLNMHEYAAFARLRTDFDGRRGCQATAEAAGGGQLKCLEERNRSHVILSSLRQGIVSSTDCYINQFDFSEFPIRYCVKASYLYLTHVDVNKAFSEFHVPFSGAHSQEVVFKWISQRPQPEII